MNEKRKKIIISICLVVVLILAIIGVSYAAFTFIGQGNKVNQITTGTIRMNYEEGTNVIRLNNALPTTDATGKVRLNEGEYFDFSVTTNITGDAVINWEIAAEDFDDNTFDGSNVKFYLTKLVDGNEVEVSSSLPAVYNEKTKENSKTGRPANMMSLLTGSTGTQGEEVTNYRLRLYVDEAYNPQGDGGGLVFKTRINVYGKVSTDKELPMMMDFGGNAETNTLPTGAYYEYRNQITNIEVKTDTQIPPTAAQVENGKGNYWDISEAQDDSVIAYLEETGETISYEYCDENWNCEDRTGPSYKLTIGGNKGVEANPNCTVLFGRFINLTNIDLSKLDTSRVINMNSMFVYCNNLTSLDVNSFDTPNVTDMSGMFAGCSNLIALDLSNLDTSKVKNMSGMFAYCSNLTNLNLSSFYISDDTVMDNILNSCDNLTNLNLSNLHVLELTNLEKITSLYKGKEKLTTLDLSGFNAPKITSLSGMFQGCSNLTTLNLKDFQTANVTNMSNMFAECRNLTNPDLTSFDTSNVVNMRGMFCGCEKLTNLDISHFDLSKLTHPSNSINECDR